MSDWLSLSEGKEGESAAIAVTGGVMGITLIRSFVCAREPATIENALDHIDRVARLSGVEHIGIGTDVDLDGRAKLPREKLKGTANQPSNNRPGPNQRSQEDLRST